MILIIIYMTLYMKQLIIKTEKLLSVAPIDFPHARGYKIIIKYTSII